MQRLRLKRKSSADSITDAYLAREKRAKVEQRSASLDGTSPAGLSPASDQSDVFESDWKQIRDEDSSDSFVAISNENVNDSNVDPATQRSDSKQNASQPNVSQQTSQKEISSISSSVTSAGSSNNFLSMLSEIVGDCKQAIHQIAHLTNESASNDETLKDHLLPHKKSPLFSDSDLLGQKRVQANVRRLIDETRRDVPQLFTDDELAVLDAFGRLSNEAQQFLLLFLLKRDRWTFDGSINAFRDFQTLKNELLESDFILDCLPENFSTLEEVLYLLDPKELAEMIKANKQPFLKGKVKMISSLVLFVRSNKPINSSENLEFFKIEETCKLLGSRGAFRVNKNKCKSIWKILLINFAAPKFDKTVYAHFHSLL